MDKRIDQDICRKDVLQDGFCLFICYEAGRDAMFELCQKLNTDPLSQAVIFDKANWVGTHYLLYLGDYEIAMKVFQKHFEEFVRRVDEIQWQEEKDRRPNLYRPCRFRWQDLQPPGMWCQLQAIRQSL